MGGRREGEGMIITRMFLARRRLGLTQAALGAMVGVTQPRISAWETGAVAIPDARRDALARALRLDPTTLTDEA
jgi:transcriptional regulator with XRE-family HTH domain